MSEWKKVKLGEITIIKTGKLDSNAAVPNGAYPFFTCDPTTLSIDKWAYDTEAILLAGNNASGNYTAKYYKGKFNAYQRTYIIETLNPQFASVRYMAYAMNQQLQLLKVMSSGSTTKFLTMKMLTQLSIDLPSIETQNRIATILSRYDSLIENYQKQIKLLEEAAQRLYKEWFVDLHFSGHENTKIVDGVPEGWEKKPISQLGEYLNGFAFKPSDWQESGKPIIKIKEMGNGVSNDTPRNNGERVPAKYLVKAGDLLFSWSATLMVIVWSGEEGWLNQHLFKVTPAKGIGREFLLQSISNTIEEFQNLTTGSTMKHIQRNKLDQVFTNVPNDEIMALYSNFAESMRNHILHLSSQISFLTEARDRLLPQLMSGEIEAKQQSIRT
ncbi:MAG: restriction endonuclease subunit S [Bacteroidaceae bacterium]|nr:restriction endonuclease subunit S [Bacteroidaceae bacterium]